MNSSTPKLRIENISLSFGGTNALTDVSFRVNEGEIFAIIGPNGAGKTSMLNCVNNFYKPNSGHIYFNDLDLTKLPPHKIAKLGIARTFQNLALYSGLSTLDNIMAARHIHMQTNMLGSMIYWGFAHKEDVAHRKVVEDIIDFLEIQHIRKSVVGSLPHGLRKRVELARGLALEPEILLLDEPMTGMNLEEKEDMARFILDIHELQNTTILLIEHDMGLVMDIADRIVVLDFGQKIAEGTPDEIRKNSAVIKAYLGEEVQ